MIFSVFKVYQGYVYELSRWDGKLNLILIAYLLSNNSTKSYWNQTATVKVIVEGWVVYFFCNAVYFCYTGNYSYFSAYLNSS